MNTIGEGDAFASMIKNVSVVPSTQEQLTCKQRNAEQDVMSDRNLQMAEPDDIMQLRKQLSDAEKKIKQLRTELHYAVNALGRMQVQPVCKLCDRRNCQHYHDDDTYAPNEKIYCCTAFRYKRMDSVRKCMKGSEYEIAE